MMEYLKYLPLLSVIARHPHSIQALQDSIPDAQKIIQRFVPFQEDLQQMIAELEATLRQIEGLPPQK